MISATRTHQYRCGLFITDSTMVYSYPLSKTTLPEYPGIPDELFDTLRTSLTTREVYNGEGPSLSFITTYGANIAVGVWKTNTDTDVACSYFIKENNHDAIINQESLPTGYTFRSGFIASNLNAAFPYLYALVENYTSGALYLSKWLLNTDTAVLTQDGLISLEINKEFLFSDFQTSQNWGFSPGKITYDSEFTGIDLVFCIGSKDIFIVTRDIRTYNTVTLQPSFIIDNAIGCFSIDTFFNYNYSFFQSFGYTNPPSTNLSFVVGTTQGIYAITASSTLANISNSLVYNNTQYHLLDAALSIYVVASVPSPYDGIRGDGNPSPLNYLITIDSSIPGNLSYIESAALITQDSLQSLTTEQAYEINSSGLSNFIINNYNYNPKNFLVKFFNSIREIKITDNLDSGNGLDISSINTFPYFFEYADTLPLIGNTSVTDIPDIAVGVPYSERIFSSGGGDYIFPLHCEILTGTLPDGISLSTDGYLTGTASSASFTPVTAAVGVGNIIDIYTISKTGPAVTELPPSCNEEDYNYTFTLPEGWTSPYYWEISGAIPSGLSFYSTIGQIAGTLGGFNGLVDASGIYTFTVTFIDSNMSVSQDYSLTVWPTPTFLDATKRNRISGHPPEYWNYLPDAYEGVYWSYTIPVSRTTPEATFSVVGGTLPTGLTLNTITGEISGTATSTNNNFYTFDIEVNNNNSTNCRALLHSIIIIHSLVDPPMSPFTSNTLEYILEVVQPPEFVTSSPLPSGCTNKQYANTIYGSYGVYPYTFSITAGALPTGLTLSNTGYISGTVTDLAGIYTFTVDLTDSVGNVISKEYTLEVNESPSILTTILSNAIYGVAYSETILTANTDPSAVIDIIIGSLPPGLALDTATGVVSGTPSSTYNGSFMVQVTNSTGCLDKKEVFLTVQGTGVAPTLTGTFPPICKNYKYTYIPTTTDGIPPFTYNVSIGTLPPGLSISRTTGEVLGFPNQAGSFDFSITVTDSDYLTGTQTFNILVYDSPTIVIKNLPSAVWNKPYEVLFTSSGGTPPRIWNIEESLPNGLTFNSMYGYLSGIPVAYGTFDLHTSVVDANGCKDSKLLSLNIYGPPKINTLFLPPACQNIGYRVNILVDQGLPPYTWFISSNNLPPDALFLNPYNGQLSGIPKIYGTFTFSVGIRDNNGLYDQVDYDLLVRPEAECAGELDPLNPKPGEAEAELVKKPRLISLFSKPAVVKDPFHQKNLPDYLPSPFLIEEE